MQWPLPPVTLPAERPDRRRNLIASRKRCVLLSRPQRSGQRAPIQSVVFRIPIAALNRRRKYHHRPRPSYKACRWNQPYRFPLNRQRLALRAHIPRQFQRTMISSRQRTLYPTASRPIHKQVTSIFNASRCNLHRKIWTVPLKNQRPSCRRNRSQSRNRSRRRRHPPIFRRGPRAANQRLPTASSAQEHRHGKQPRTRPALPFRQ